MNIYPPTPRIILMIGDDGVVVVPYRIEGAAPFFMSAANNQGMPEVLAFIAQYPKARVTLCADNLAQDYRGDQLPRLNMFDRAKLVQRRLKQHFPSARLTASLRFKKSRDQNLMIGLHETNPVFIWADKLRTQTPDIVLVPVEGAKIVARLMPECAKGWAMMICFQRSGGFRQIVTYKGDLIFTRLTPLPDGDEQGDAALIARDIKASLDYLTRHGLRDAHELSVLLLLPGAIDADPVFENLPIRSLRSLSPFAAAKQLGLPFAPGEEDQSADLVFAAQFLTARKALPLMLPEARQIWWTRTIQKWGMRAACLALLFTLSSAIWQASALVMTVLHTHQESAQLEQARRALAQAQASAAPVTEPLGRLRQALERQHIYQQQTPTPWQGLNELSGGMAADAKIVRLDWKKDGEHAPEIFTLALRVAKTGERAETVAAFDAATHRIAQAMQDYRLSVIKPPYPSLPQEAVSAAPQNDADDPVGEIALQRKTP